MATKATSGSATGGGATSKRSKARALRKSTQRSIAKFKEQHPRTSFVDLAAHFNCTYDQARDAWRRYQDGELAASPGRRKTRWVKPSGDPIGTLRALVDRALTALHGDGSLDGVELINLLDRAAPVLRIVQQLSLTGHIKGADALIVAALIRRYQPNATDDDVVRIFHEVRIECQQQLR